MHCHLSSVLIALRTVHSTSSHCLTAKTYNCFLPLVCRCSLGIKGHTSSSCSVGLFEVLVLLCKSLCVSLWGGGGGGVGGGRGRWAGGGGEYDLHTRYFTLQPIPTRQKLM